MSDNLRNLCDNIKNTNICIIRSQKEKKEKGTENLLEEIIAEKFTNLGKDIRHLSPGTTESPKQDEPKKVHTKTYYN